jgi:predicted aspartyl protease
MAVAAALGLSLVAAQMARRSPPVSSWTGTQRTPRGTAWAAMAGHAPNSGASRQPVAFEDRAIRRGIISSAIVFGMQYVPLIIEADQDEPDCAEVLVDGTISGRPFRFMLDTAAARTQVIADEAIAALPSQAQHESSGVFAPSSNPLVTIHDLRIGPLAVPALEVARIAAAQPGGCSLLGMDVLGRQCCHLRFGTGQLALQHSPAGQASLPLEIGDHGHAYLDVHWPGITARACFDTGAGITLVSQDFLRAHPRLFTTAGTSTGTDGSGAQVQTATFVMTGAHIGDALFAPHKAAATDLSHLSDQATQPVDLILGYPTLRQADWLLDFPARRWALTRQPNSH